MMLFCKSSKGMCGLQQGFISSDTGCKEVYGLRMGFCDMGTPSARAQSC